MLGLGGVEGLRTTFYPHPNSYSAFQQVVNPYAFSAPVVLSPVCSLFQVFRDQGGLYRVTTSSRNNLQLCQAYLLLPLRRAAPKQLKAFCVDAL